MKLYHLYKTIKLRKRPEDVAAMILEFIGDELTPDQTKIIRRAAKGSLKNQFLQYTSMLQSFASPDGAGRQINKAIELFRLENQPEVNGLDVESVEQFIRQISPLIQKTFGKSDFLKDRLNRHERKASGLDISKRRYNKLFRHLLRMERKLEAVIKNYKMLEFQQIAKHGIVHRLTYESFAQDKYSACFIAYYTARCNLRSQFTIQGQTRPFDKIAELLFDLAQKQGEPNYLAMAYVYPAPRILENLPDKERGQLLGAWTRILEELAGLLRKLWEENDIARDTMIVKRGNDSSSWNGAAGAWNKARDAWMNLIYAMGVDFVLDNMCFGKVMRLMAADLVAWHGWSGNGLDPNTKVWKSLPLPWEVFEGKAVCTRKKVKKACHRAGIDAETSGWIAPRPHGVVEFTPTPELVHGVSVENAFLAKVLKKNGYFSGKKAKWINIKLN